jgi:LAO/AO transport system kinase
LKNWSVEELLSGFKAQDKNALARAITYAESLKPEHQKLTQELLEALPVNTISKRVGISGTPGVGKSTFIESFGLTLTASGHRVAVLAVDPTSQVSGGSILGDKTRMELLAREPRAFIRPSPSGGSLGGVARRTREAILLCEAFGFDIVLVETVGVGQSETAVARMVDCFVMLLQPGAGDDLQGIKRGILELVDMVVVTKADGANKELAQAARHHYEQALHILRHDTWQPPVIPCSALEKTGLTEVWQTIERYFTQLGSGLEVKRAQQRLHWLDESLRESLMTWFEEKLDQKNWQKIRQAVESGKKPVQEAVNELLKKLK